ncbi:MAG TPA: stage II sporulation protein M, partial [Anaerolineae bacterium]|nr:stage II sporulation protein M [Anaerolineae bacterium]
RHQVVTYLNQLVGQAHAVVYRGEPLELRRVWRYYRTGFPRLYRQTASYTLVAMLLFLLPGLIALAITATHPAAAYTLLPTEMHDIIALVEDGEMWTDIPHQARSMASSFIMTNNIQVAFLAFAGGVLAGLLTIYILVFNGLLIGTIAGLCHAHGLSLALWSFVLPHGVIELSVIFIAGGAGLMLGRALVSPGLLSRQDALAAAARRAVRLIFGCVPLLVVAGTIEGFVSPSALPAWAKLAIGAATGLLLYGYLLGAGRREGRDVRSSSVP